jgi:putative DNA primase/helicase
LSIAQQSQGLKENDMNQIEPGDTNSITTQADRSMEAQVREQLTAESSTRITSTQDEDASGNDQQGAMAASAKAPQRKADADTDTLPVSPRQEQEWEQQRQQASPVGDNAGANRNLGQAEGEADADDRVARLADRLTRLHLVAAQRSESASESKGFIKKDPEPSGPKDSASTEAKPPRSATRVENAERTPMQEQRDVLSKHILRALSNRYLIADDKYYFRDRQQTLAFEDHGKRIATAHDDPEVAHSMVELAEAKGWGSIKLKGSEAFRREVWLAARQRGMDVTGFRPKLIDKARLADILAERNVEKPNIVEKDMAQDTPATAATTRETRDIDALPPQAAASLSKRQQQALNQLKTLLRDRGDSEKAIEMTTAIGAEQLLTRRSYVGKLVDHGAARYEHHKDEPPSYFVVLDTPRGEKTIWGVDLQRALEDGKVERGTDVVLSQIGKSPVTVPANERDEDGKPTGRRSYLDTIRNEWEVTTVDDMRDIAASRAVMANTGRNLPEQPRLPASAPAQNTAPRQERQRAADGHDRQHEHPAR